MRVSILTRPWGRVQPSTGLSSVPPTLRFQFSPALGGECNRRLFLGGTAPDRGFNSHPPLGASATSLARTKGVRVAFQFSPALGGECNSAPGGAHASAHADRREFQFSPALGGECNLACPNSASVSALQVSILTRPWGRVQRTCRATLSPAASWAFQFSPALGGECNRLRCCAFAISSTFQFSPALGGECNMRQRKSSYFSARMASFNSHPPLGASATLRRTSCWCASRFQFSPALGGECNAPSLSIFEAEPHKVSILTRPWGRVQQPSKTTSRPRRGFQFSPALGGECNNLAGVSAYLRPTRLFQFSPALGGECNLTRTTMILPPVISFNSHPPLGASATVSVYLKRRTICKS